MDRWVSSTGVEVTFLLRKPQTKGSCSFMDLGALGGRERMVKTVGKVLGTESEWGKLSSSFPMRRLPNRSTWAGNAAVHKSMAGQGPFRDCNALGCAPDSSDTL